MADQGGAVRYATSADGTAIGYQRSGSGPTIVSLPVMATSLRTQGIVTSDRSALSFADVVTYDRRGTGYSDRDVDDFSMDTAIADLAAVVDATVSGPAVVRASWDQGPIGMRFAAEFPDRVSHLVLDSTFANGARLFDEVPSMRILRLVLREDWDYFLRVIMRVQGDLEHPTSDEAEAIMREDMSAETTRAQFEAISTYDATAWLSSISVPTLLAQRTRVSESFHTHSSLRELAKQIPQAVLVRSDGAEYSALAQEFIGSDPRREVHGPFRTVMFTDLVSSTALTQQIGDEAAQQVVEAHDAAVQEALAGHNGALIKHTGDGIMAAFDSATDAARAAQVLARRLSHEGVKVRVGLNAGEPIERDGDLFGTAVQLAARLGDAAADGQVLATQVVRDLTEGKGLNWSAAPAIEAKGFDQPIPVFTLNLTERAIP
jgi:class 3 adenylate cyclase